VPIPTSVGEPTPARYFAGRVDAIRAHFAALAAALPKLPDELLRAGITLSRELQQRGLVRVLLLIIAFVLLGVGVEWIFHRSVGRLQQWAAALPRDTVDERLRAVAIRLAYGVGTVAVFAIGSVGAFLAFDWPPLLREIVLGYLIAFLAFRVMLVSGRFLLAPRIERFRILPMTRPEAWFWQRRLGLIVGWLGIGWVTVDLLGTLGVSLDVRRLIAYPLGVGLLVIGIESVWRRPAPAEAALAEQAAPPGAAADRISEVGWMRTRRRRIAAWLLSGYFLLLWLLWVASAMPAFWLAVVALGLPAAVKATERAVNHVLRPPGAAGGEEAVPGVIAASLARGLRALLIIGAALLLAWAWGIDLVALTARDTLILRLLRRFQAVILTGGLSSALESVPDRRDQDSNSGGRVQVRVSGEIVPLSDFEKGLRDDRTGIDSLVNEMDRRPDKLRPSLRQGPISAVNTAVKRRNARVGVYEWDVHARECLRSDYPGSVDHDHIGGYLAQYLASPLGVNAANAFYLRFGHIPSKVEFPFDLLNSLPG
jgi:hypothetical protein